MLQWIRRKKKETTSPSVEDTMGGFLKTYRRHMVVKSSMLVIVASVVLWGQAPFTERVSGSYITVINLSGAITGGVEGVGVKFSRQFQNAVEDKSSKGILIIANSGGGSPSQSGVIFDTVSTYTRIPLKDRTPVWVSVQDICASACLHAIAPADQIIASTPATLIGSVGVKLEGWDFSGLLEKVGVERRTIALGEHKTILDVYSPQSEEDAALILNTLIEPVYKQFIQDMESARGDAINKHSDTFSGLVWTAHDAIERGLADRIANPLTVEGEFFILTGTKHVQRFNSSQSKLRQLLGQFIDITLE